MMSLLWRHQRGSAVSWHAPSSPLANFPRGSPSYPLRPAEPVVGVRSGPRISRIGRRSQGDIWLAPVAPAATPARFCSLMACPELTTRQFSARIAVLPAEAGGTSGRSAVWSAHIENRATQSRRYLARPRRSRGNSSAVLQSHGMARAHYTPICCDTHRISADDGPI